MARYTKKQKTTVSVETQDEALKVAKATQRPGQSKEQTKLIAQGIQKGIEQYKKQQKEKSRELNKKLKKVSGQLNQSSELNEDFPEAIEVVGQSRLAWILLGLSWVGFTLFLFINYN